jgi:hypothetical protein
MTIIVDIKPEVQVALSLWRRFGKALDADGASLF